MLDKKAAQTCNAIRTLPMGDDPVGIMKHCQAERRRDIRQGTGDHRKGEAHWEGAGNPLIAEVRKQAGEWVHEANAEKNRDCTIRSPPSGTSGSASQAGRGERPQEVSGTL